jgi:hypothetical protein
LSIDKREGNSQIEDRRSKGRFAWFGVAGVIYLAFAVYLYWSHFKYFGRLDYLMVVSGVVGSLGCLALSRRWVSSYWASFIAGAVYGFGPFMIGLAKFHPTASFLAASVPWLFCPAALWVKGKKALLSWPLTGLPFLAIVLFFQLCTHMHFFPVSVQVKLRLADLASLAAPLVVAGRDASATLIGYYHVSLAAMVIGFSMLISGRRIGIVLLFVAGTSFSWLPSYLNVSPIMWLTVPLVICSVLVGVGVQALAEASWADRLWVLMSAAIMAVFAIVTLLLATKYFQVFAGLGDKYARLFVWAGVMYVLAAVAAGIIFFIVRAKLRLVRLRLLLLCSAMAVDIFIGARFLVDAFW